MSDLAEIWNELKHIRDTTTTTATNVEWIKNQSAGHAQEISTLKSRVDRQQGQSSILGAIAGAVLGGVIAFFTRAHG